MTDNTAIPTDAGSDDNAGSDWMSLKDAADAAGVSISSLRKWYRQDEIQSRMVPGPRGQQREVLLDEVLERAAKYRGAPAAAQPVVSSEWQQIIERVAFSEAERATAQKDAEVAAFKLETERERLMESRAEAARLRQQIDQQHAEIVQLRAQLDRTRAILTSRQRRRLERE